MVRQRWREDMLTLSQISDALGRWWNRWGGSRFAASQLDGCGHDVERIARDLGVSAAELRQLASYGPEKTELLRRRMQLLKLEPKDLAGSDPATLRDLQKHCTLCDSRRHCARDLAQEENGETPSGEWRDYCPNGATLNMLGTLQ